MEENRIAVLSIIVESEGRREQSERINSLLSDYGEYIVAPVSAVNALTGKLGGLTGVSAKTLFSKY